MVAVYRRLETRRRAGEVLRIEDATVRGVLGCLLGEGPRCTGSLARPERALQSPR